MKKLNIILLVLFVLSGNIAFSQDIIDPQKLQRFDTTIAINREFSGFMIGWNWGAPGARLDSVMRINTYHGFSNGLFSEANTCAENMLVIEPPGRWNSYIVGARGVDCIFNAHSLYLEPALEVDTTQDFNPANWNKTGAVFGFRNKSGICIIDTNNNGQIRLNSSSVGQTPVKVLSNIWQNDCFRWLDYYDSTEIKYSTNHKNINSQADIDTFHIFNGKQLYVSINLRALDLNEIQNHLNDNILGIKLRYALTKVDTTANPDTLLPVTYDYVKFNLLPRDSIENVVDILGTRNDFRGKFRRLDTAINKPTEFTIKGSLLKIDDEGNTSNITISALAFFDGRPFGGGYLNNPIFKYDWWQNNYKKTEYISTIDVEVYYYGKLDVSMDWIRLETPRAQKVFRGGYDSAVSAAVDILLDNINNNVNKPKIYRIYANDELLPSQWATNRYLNMLIDTLAALECFTSRGNSPAHFLHATGFKEYWNGANCEFYTRTGVPFIRKSVWDSAGTFYYIFGYEGNGGFPLNPLLSEYETKLNKVGATLPITDPNIYTYEWGKDDGYIEASATQFQIEKHLYHNYYKHSSLYYSSKPWWANLWVLTDAIDSCNATINSFSIKKGGRRPLTGEEVRLLVTHPIIMGAKGLFYWKKGSDENINKAGFIGLQPYNFNYGNLQGEELLKSDNLGGDYLCFPDANKLHNGFRGSAYVLDSMGIDTNHIYLGLKSSRLTISRINEWVSRCADELMKLRLVAWYGKGYLTLKNQDPAYDTVNMFAKFLAWDNIRSGIDTMKFKIRPYGRFYIPCSPAPEEERPLYEPWDSTFFDITILKNKDTTINDLFYIGVQNRRTDPLIYFNNQYIRFLSTSEFEDSCDAELNPNGYLTMRNYYWKRLGAREFVLPFNYVNSIDNEEYALLRITELGADEEFDSTWSYGRKMAYWNKIDTVIGQDRQITFNMLPGEGKIFKVQVLHQEKNNISYQFDIFIFI